MVARIAINGFGRIERLHAIIERHENDLIVVAVNDMPDLDTNAHLLRYDTNYCGFPGQDRIGEGVLRIDSGTLPSVIKKTFTQSLENSV
jgi:glyceraldehyde 3-phosphate dehydrogenase